jgi:hypothetical protein
MSNVVAGMIKDGFIVEDSLKNNEKRSAAITSEQ